MDDRNAARRAHDRELGWTGPAAEPGLPDGEAAAQPRTQAEQEDPNRDTEFALEWCEASGHNFVNSSSCERCGKGKNGDEPGWRVVRMGP